jgi:predicted aldo/keto reductase-like oxidoreductase
MSKRDSDRDPANVERRRIVTGGLLGAAAALGFLPGCGSESSGTSADGTGGGDGNPAGGAPGAGGANPPGGAPNTSGASNPGGLSSAGGVSSAGGATNRGGAPVTGGAPPAGGGAVNATGGAPASAGGAPGAPADGGTKLVLPRATLGKTGLQIPIVGLGTSRLGQRGGTPNAKDYANMLDVFSKAIDLGIEYLDTGANYGRAEEALGEVTAGRRDKVILVTKLYTDTYSEAKTLFERSLTRLKTDHVDILHLHSAGERNLDTALGANGSWKYILEQKAAGRTRFVGITGHSNPPNFTRMLATGQVDVLMTIMNFVDHSTYGFSQTIREDAVSRGVGVMAMKIFGGTESNLVPGGGLVNSDAPVPHPSNMELSFDVDVLPDCIRFVKGLGGITGMVIGVNYLAEVERNIRWAIDAVPFNAQEMDAVIKLGQTVSSKWARRYG